MRLGALALVYVAATAMAARKEPAGVNVTGTGFTIVESAKAKGVHALDAGAPKRVVSRAWTSSPVKGYRSVGPRQCTAISVPRIRSRVASNRP